MNKQAKDNYEILLALDKTQKRINELRARELQLPPIEALVLSTIRAIPGEATPSKISQRVFRRPHSVSALLQRMEKKGLVKRDRNLEKKNMVGVTMTEKGKQVYRKSTREKSLHEAMAVLSEEDRQQLRSCLRKLYDNCAVIWFKQKT
ncbi:hypothetical protein ES705_20090 [subsurface metagenome]